MTNAEQEMEWINAWNELYELQDIHPGASIFVVDGHPEEVSEVDAQGWIQNAAYQSFRIFLEISKQNGSPCILIRKLHSDAHPS